MDEDVARFWQAFEEETGERVEARAIGELHPGAREAGVWCLLVLTDRSFWFKQVPSESGMAALFRFGGRGSTPRRADEYTLRVPREHLLALEEPDRARRGWFPKPGFPELALTWRTGEGTETRRFSMDPSTDLLTRLRQLFPEKAPGSAQEPR